MAESTHEKQGQKRFEEGFDPVAYINTPRWLESRYGLERTFALLAKLGNPHNTLKFVHVAGTNGKGSTCAYLASILQAAGYKTGLFTSPYIERFEERIRVNGQNIPEDDLMSVTLDVRDAADAVEAETGDHPTEFELMTGVAFTYFARSGCDIVVCEVGLGGELDSTNVIPRPEASVIVRLGLDHTALLGDTIDQIAQAKAGIIKQGCPVLTYPQEPEALEVIEAKAKSMSAPVTIADFALLEIGDVSTGIADNVPMRAFSFGNFGPMRTRLLASYQPFNAAMALEVVRVLRAGGWSIPDKAVREGVEAATWPGRFEVARLNPTVIVDGGHNPQGSEALASSLDSVFPGKRPVFAIGLLADKDYPTMLRTLVPYGSRFVCMKPNNPRALEAADLAAAIREALLATGCAEDALPEIEVEPDYDKAIARAVELAGPDGMVVASGSLYQVADVKAALRKLD